MGRMLHLICFTIHDIPVGEGVQTLPDVQSDHSIMARHQKSMLHGEWEKHGEDLKSQFGPLAAEEMLEIKK